ncbi:hypothetical protein [Streptomyces sp. CC210A]|uniref:hypothetical protein n=1 Tax=Streptomyces sp. CC210A TaxID=2898184 RepID=UPI001F1FE619|nr:hypothetical protein [Streptomyces sp. CC210A]
MTVPPPVGPPPTWLAATALAGPPQPVPLTDRQRRGRQCADCAVELTAATARPLPRRFPLRVCVRCSTARCSR